MNNNKKKILYIVTKSNWGGAQKYVFDLATSLPKDKFETIVAFGGHEELEQKLQKGGIKTISMQSLQRDVSILKEVKVFFELLSLYRKTQPDIVHLNSSKIGILGSLAALLLKLKNYKLKTVFTVHGWAFNENRNLLTRLVIWIASWLTAILCTDLIVLSKKEYSQTKTFPLVREKKIHLIANGLRSLEFLTKEQAREKLRLKKEEIYVGTISELHKNKGLDILIRTAPNINGKIVIIGSGEEESELKNLASELGILEKILFLGTVQDAGKYLTAFDLFVLTSRKEGLPYVLLEAGYAELPIVASNIGGIPEIIKDGETGLLSESENIRDVQVKIEKLLNNRDYATQLGKDSKIYIEQNFSFEKTLKLTEQVYKK